MTSRLRVESLEDRWNLSTLDPLGAAMPDPVPASTAGVASYSAPADPTNPSTASALPRVSSYSLVIDPRASAVGERQGYYTVTLEYVLVSSYSTSGTAPGLVSQPTEPEPAQIDYFLKLKGIDGEATSATDDIWVDGRVITGQDYDSAGGTHSEQGGAGKVQMQDFHFVAMASEASPKLFLICANGQHVEPESPDDFAASTGGAGIHVPIKIKHGL